LSRRVHDLELELTSKNEKLQTLEKEKKDLSERLGSVYREQ
jgi:uncharacterized protein YlxW (UPF0749 family)